MSTLETTFSTGFVCRKMIACFLATFFLFIAAQVKGADQNEFFEKSVRPLLLKHCVECHGAKKQESGLRFDNGAFIKNQDDIDDVVVPGKADASRLYQVLLYSEDDIQMPPEEKMSDQEINVIKHWLESGAYWPEQEMKPQKKLGGPYDFEALRSEHWSYRPIVNSPLPEVEHSDRVKTEVDTFVLNRLEQEGLTLSPQADKRTLLRRLKFDLLGLPPTYQEVQEFIQNDSPDAYAELVEKYLSAPEYGQRWGRHWLDVARYADTKGYVFTAEQRFGYSYTYRDYVIESFNADKPYNQFILEQLAADQLDLAEPKKELAAMGFLTVGRRFRNNQHDIIDDRIDVVSRGLMGITAGCARCHDHKYDPIPTEDYYSLYGVFASSEEPANLPLIGEPLDQAAHEEFKQKMAEFAADLDKFEREESTKLQHNVRQNTVAYLLKNVASKNEIPPEHRGSYGKHEIRGQLVKRWNKYLKEQAKPEHAVWGPWARLSKMTPEQLTAEANTQLSQLQQQGGFNSVIVEKLLGRELKSMNEVALVYGEAFKEIENEVHALAERSASLNNPDKEQLRAVLYGEQSPVQMSHEEWKKLFDRGVRNGQRQRIAKQDKFRAMSPGAPPRAMVMNDKAKPFEPQVFIRGSAGRKGKKVPRQFFQILEQKERQPYQTGSGRLELAQKIISPDNPLTARVFVNRVWMLHFGNGIVRTPSDFGTRSEEPTHPELLDYLAWQFIHGGWSVKDLHRLIVNSATYQQSGSGQVAGGEQKLGAKVNPENTLLWEMPRRRIEFEAMRDSMLAASNRLDARHGGKAVDLLGQPSTQRRTVYGFVNRNNFPTLFRVFDSASPDVSTPQRPQTTVPQQALFGMNSPFVIEQAKHLSQYSLQVAGEAPQDRVRLLYEQAFARQPNEQEAKAALAFVSELDVSQAEPTSENSDFDQWDKLAQILLMTNEFMFID